MPSSAALLGRAEEEDNTDDYSSYENVKPFEMAALKARAFRYILLFLSGARNFTECVRECGLH
jgi:hypothetical protein